MGVEMKGVTYQTLALSPVNAGGPERHGPELRHRLVLRDLVGGELENHRDTDSQPLVCA